MAYTETPTRRKTRRMAALEQKEEVSDPSVSLSPKGKKAKIREEEKENSSSLRTLPSSLLSLVMEGVRGALDSDSDSDSEADSKDSEEETEEESGEESQDEEESEEEESEEVREQNSNESKEVEEKKGAKQRQEKKEKKKWSLDPGVSLKKDIYFSSGRHETDAGRLNQVEANNTSLNSILAKKSEFYSFETRNIGKKDPTKHALKKMRKAEKEKTAGKRWFDLPATQVDFDTKRDLQILRMRGNIYKDRFFKGDTKELPKYFQVGRVVSGAAEHYNKISRKDRKKSFAEEILGDSQMKNYAKRKFLEVQYEKSRGGHATARPKKRRRVEKKK
mmetsp:Transcript_33630/g.52570  ORF Transcript_33630/g.52570 Transcript_33630/m.52570 type:complete len:333 (-) Transcript_33630:19-1017(-)